MDMKLQKGTRLFLDRKSSASKPKIENVLKKIGVIVDEFLSKDVDFIVTDSKVPSRTLGKNFTQEGFQKLLLSRGQTLLMKSTSVNSASQFKIDPVQFAQKFGVPLITGDELKKNLQTTLANYKYIKKKSSKDTSLLILEYNFVKIEDDSQRFLPSFKKFLELSQKESMEINNLTTLKKILTKENCGYCECCDEFCDSLSFHRKSQAHLSFTLNDKNFICIDMLINQLPSLDNLKASEKKMSYFTSEETDAEHLKTIMFPFRNKTQIQENVETYLVGPADKFNSVAANVDLQDYSMQFISNFTKYKNVKIFPFSLNLGTHNIINPGISSCLGCKQFPTNCIIKTNALYQDTIFQHYNISNRQTSTDIYTCIPFTDLGQELKLVLKRITPDSYVKIRKAMPSKNISWQGFVHQQNNSEAEFHGYGSFPVCNESNKDWESRAKKKERKQIKAKRRCKSNKKKSEQNKLAFHNDDVSCQPLYNTRKISTLCDFIKDYDRAQSSFVVNNCNCWSLRYVTDLKVVLTKPRSC